MLSAPVRNAAWSVRTENCRRRREDTAGAGQWRREGGGERGTRQTRYWRPCHRDRETVPRNPGLVAAHHTRELRCTADRSYPTALRSIDPLTRMHHHLRARDSVPQLPDPSPSTLVLSPTPQVQHRHRQQNLQNVTESSTMTGSFRTGESNPAQPRTSDLTNSERRICYRYTSSEGIDRRACLGS